MNQHKQTHTWAVFSLALAVAVVSLTAVAADGAAADHNTPMHPSVELSNAASPVTAKPATEQWATATVEPIIQAEIQQGLKNMQLRMIADIEAWGQRLKPQDFELSWTGRQLNKAKRQEVCGIYQKIVNDTLRMAVQNQARLSPHDQSVLKDRNAFIQSLGFKNNIVDTKMGFNCRMK